MAHVIDIKKAPGCWTVRAAGSVLGESRDALILTETGLPPVTYFPRKDIAMALLDPSDHTTECPYKGTATYFDVVTQHRTLKNAVWSYENPKDAASDIKGHLCFYPGDYLQVEEL